ncbi:hypothetical protein N7492_008730 [Penicillium capsulatum]|uniref:Uncharacterized protein n=1 Tax=Penicillium capsulatum TaxID=69766 RepID=A0A9W9HS04_9EURO|nr:hypothetical protein N7492_008730 [Penicillium capsulatum]
MGIDAPSGIDTIENFGKPSPRCLIESIAPGIPSPILDWNLYRVLALPSGVPQPGVPFSKVSILGIDSISIRIFNHLLIIWNRATVPRKKGAVGNPIDLIGPRISVGNPPKMATFPLTVRASILRMPEPAADDIHTRGFHQVESWFLPEERTEVDIAHRLPHRGLGIDGTSLANIFTIDVNFIVATEMNAAQGFIGTGTSPHIRVSPIFQVGQDQFYRAVAAGGGIESEE